MMWAPVLLGMVALSCAWAASKKEDAFNIENLGESYREYVVQVPSWNAPKALARRLLRDSGEL